MSVTSKIASRPPAAGRPVGLIGCGLMGLAIAERLLAAGHEVFGWDISAVQRKALEKLRGRLAGNAREVFAKCERVVLSLPDDKIVARILPDVDSALRPGQIIVDTSTGAPDAAVRFGRTLAKRRVIYVDATVSGNSAQLRKSEVLLMVGGSKKAFARCQDLFRPFSKQAIHTGPCGSGTRMKLVTNLVLGLNRAALAEGLAFAAALGLDGDQTLAILRESMAYSRIMDTKGEKMLRGDFTPQAKLSQHLKDVRLMFSAAAGTGAKLPLSETHRQLLELAEAAGLGNLDNSAIIRVIETPSTVSARFKKQKLSRRDGARRSKQ